MKPIYLEPDEEITSVIDKLSAVSDHSLALVVPKNSTLFQSLVNLKLLAKEAKEQGKQIAIISTNRVGQRLAEQVGLTTYTSLGSIAPGSGSKPIAPSNKPVAPTAETINGVRVNQYTPDIPVGNMLDEPAEDLALPAPTAEEAALPPEVLAGSTLVAADEALSLDKKEAPAQKEILAKDDIKNPVVLPPIANESKKDSDSLPPIVSRTIRMSAPKEPFVMPWKLVAIGSVITLLALLVIYFFLPKATVVLTFPAKSVDQTLDLTINSQVATGQPNTVSGNLLTVTESDKKAITATGQKDIGSKATGGVTLYNKASSSSVTVAAGTTLTTSSKTFVLDSTVTIPGASVSGGNVVAGQANGNITASSSGDAGNVSNATFTINNQPALVYATGSTTGGLTKQVTILSQTDIDGAVNDLKTTLSNQATTDLKGKATKQTLLDNSTAVSVSSQSADQPVGAQVTSANLTMTVQGSVIAFDQTAVTNAVKAAASKDLKSSEQLVVPNATSITLTFKSLADDKSSMVVTTALQGYIVPKIDKTTIAKMIAHHTVSSASTLLKNRYQVTGVKVALHPSWWPHQLPFLSQAIGVDYGFNVTPASTGK